MKWILVDGIFYNLNRYTMVKVKNNDDGDIMLQLNPENRSDFNTYLNILPKKRIEKRSIHIDSMIGSLNEGITHLLKDNERGFLDVNNLVDYEIDNGENLIT